MTIKLPVAAQPHSWILTNYRSRRNFSAFAAVPLLRKPALASCET